MNTIFVVDDSDTNLATAKGVPEKRCNVMAAPSAAKIFTLLEKNYAKFDFMNIETPEMNGFEYAFLL